MKRTDLYIAILGLAVTASLTSLAYGQDATLPTPSPIEKTLAARATHTTEVTLDKTMLAFASKFMDGKNDDGKDDPDDKAVKQMIQNLRGVYVRDYEFDKDHAYSAEELEGLRKYFESSDWSPMVKDRTKGKSEGTDIYVKLVNNQMQGLFILDAEPKELSLVMILGPIDIDKLSELGGNFGIPKDAMKRAQKAEAGK
jgi:hypothetical protein